MRSNVIQNALVHTRRSLQHNWSCPNMPFWNKSRSGYRLCQKLVSDFVLARNLFVLLLLNPSRMFIFTHRAIVVILFSAANEKRFTWIFAEDENSILQFEQIHCDSIFKQNYMWATGLMAFKWSADCRPCPSTQTNSPNYVWKMDLKLH